MTYFPQMVDIVRTFQGIKTSGFSNALITTWKNGLMEDAADAVSSSSLYFFFSWD